jgi:Calcium/calmodulin dependent protein kinase II association domain
VDDPAADELLRLTRRLLDAITAGDWETYQELCDPSLTAFEPEAAGHLVRGLEFHQFYFKPGGANAEAQTTLASPEVRLMGESAVVTYVRLIQRAAGGQPVTTAFEETRVWQRIGGKWRHVHFHRSAASGGWARPD